MIEYLTKECPICKGILYYNDVCNVMYCNECGWVDIESEEYQQQMCVIYNHNKTVGGN